MNNKTYIMLNHLEEARTECEKLYNTSFRNLNEKDAKEFEKIILDNNWGYEYYKEKGY